MQNTPFAQTKRALETDLVDVKPHRWAFSLLGAHVQAYGQTLGR
jgi:hypothetical protein